MSRRGVSWLLLAGLVFLPHAPAAADGGGAGGAVNRAAPGLVEVRFTSGSVVVMTLLQEQIEVQTDYGKLTVPSRDLREIEFGIRPSDEERRRVEDAIKRLAADAFPDREAAVRDLVSLGPAAYQRLVRANPVEGLEAAKRAESALKQIKEKYHPRLLRVREEDVVRTVKFTIVGRVTTPAVKAKAEDFGELELRPAKLLALSRLAEDAKKEVTVEAATYGAPGAEKWLDTGVQVDSHHGLKVTATGQVDLWPQQPGQYLAGPDGQTGAAAPGVAVGAGRVARLGGGVTGGELLGRIGTDGAPFVVGSSYTRTPKEAGKLYLKIAPSPWGNPSTGAYRVTITTGGFGDED